MSDSASRAVFLSYASQDADAARRISEALRGGGVEVWFDADGGLEHGDEWDAKIRRQIKECVLFIPVISANTQARHEGYFRIEWDLAAERARGIASGVPFILPVVIDDTREPAALVPDRFRMVQWTRLRGGEVPPDVQQRLLKLWSHRTGALQQREMEPGRPRPGERGEGAASPANSKAGFRVPAAAWIAAAAILAVVALAIWQPWRRDSNAPTAVTAAPPASAPPIEAQTLIATPPVSAVATTDAKSVAVLAFKNLSGDPAREFFSDGLSEAVTDVLGRVPGLKVVGSASAFSFKGKAVSIPEMARQLGVTHLVEGTVLQEGQTVRITAKLITADGFQVWVSDKLDRELRNIFALHDEVAGLIAKNLSLKLGASSAASKAPVNPEAFELYVQARHAWHRRTPEGFNLAERLLTRALTLEPNFARAHAALADVWAQRHYRTPGALEADAQSGARELARVKAKIRHALTLDPNSAEALASLGDVLTHEGRRPEAELELRRAVALNPNLAVARQWLGGLLLNRAHIDEALEHLKLATELDPLAPIIWAFYGGGLRYAGRYAEGILATDRALALWPSDWRLLWYKVTSLVALGRSAETVNLVRPLPSDDAEVAAIQLFVFARAGLRAEAEGVFAKHRSSGNFSLWWAGGLVALGRTEEAMALLAAHWFNPYVAMDYLWDPIFDPLRNDPRWVKLMADAGLTEAHARAQAWRQAHPPEKTAR